MLDNVPIAILTKVNELAQRLGIKPYEFVAVFDNTHDDYVALRFEACAAEDERKAATINKMLDLIGIKEGMWELRGNDAQIIDALDNALHLAPKPRRRL